jgi:Ca2+-binding EF-hand superfamily protein
MDADGSGYLDFMEFKRALDDYKVGCSQEEAEILFQIFDRNHDGTVNFDEFLFAVVGELNEFRMNLVK